LYNAILLFYYYPLTLHFRQNYLQLQMDLFHIQQNIFYAFLNTIYTMHFILQAFNQFLSTKDSYLLKSKLLHQLTVNIILHKYLINFVFNFVNYLNEYFP